MKTILTILVVTIVDFSIVGGQLIKITPISRIVTKSSNDSYNVSCEIVQHSGKGEWYGKNGQKIPFKRNSNIRQEFIQNGTTLILDSLRVEDSGSFTCKYPPVSVTFNLNVLAPIEFNEKLTEQWAAEATHYRMKCPAYVQSPDGWSVVWLVNGLSPASYSGKLKTTKDGLILYNISQEDANLNYTCQILQTDENTETKNIFNVTFHVYSKDSPTPPHKTFSSSERWGVVGHWANITCVVVARPAAEITWHDSHNQLIADSANSTTIENDENVSNLLIFVKTDDVFSQYICSAQNVLGHVMQTFSLKKAQLPPTPFITPEVIGARQVHFKVIHENDTNLFTEENERIHGKHLPIIGRNVQYKLLNQLEWASVSVSKTTNYEEGFVLHGLLPSTPYWVRCALQNAAALGEYSQAVKITTDRDRNENRQSQNCLNGDLSTKCSYGNNPFDTDALKQSRRLDQPFSFSAPLLNYNAVNESIHRSKITIITESTSSRGISVTTMETTIEETLQQEEATDPAKRNVTVITSKTVVSITENALPNGTLITTTKTMAEETKSSSIL